MTRRSTCGLVVLAALASTPATIAVAGCSSASAGAAPLSAEGGEETSAPDASINDAPPTDDAAGAPPILPLVLTQGGPVLGALKLVTVTFAGDPNVDQVEAYGDWVVGSSWLGTASEYGVGKGTHAKKVRLVASAPTTAASIDIQKILVDAMTAGTVPTPASDKDPFLYAVYFPATTLLTEQDGTVHCKGFSGYHTEGSVGGVHFAFAAIGDCPTYVADLDELENIQRTASHEILEAATDPLVSSAPGYQADDTSNPWSFLGGELADICPISGIVRDGAFLAQRFWSNAAAKAGTNPCIPAPSGEYFIAGTTPTTTRTVAAGTSATFAIRGYSTAPDAKPWKIQAKALSAGKLTVTSTLDTASMTNGGTATLTVTVPAGAASKSSAVVAIYSYRTTDSFTYWPIGITVP